MTPISTVKGWTCRGTLRDSAWVVNHDTVSRRIQDYRQSSPAIATDAQGNAIIAWEDYRGGTVNVRYQFAPAGMQVTRLTGVRH